MTEQAKYEIQKKKLEELCEKHSFSYKFDHDSYPITLAIRPLQGMFEQLSLLEAAENGEGRISQDAVYTFVKRDGDVQTRVYGIFTMSENLRDKFKGIFKKICDFWEQFFFRTVMETKALRSGLMPVIDEAEGEPEYNGDPGDDAPLHEPTSDCIGEELISQAIELVRMENKATVSMLQRHLKMGYYAADKLMSILESRGIVGPYRGSEPREVLPYDEPEQ